MSGAELYLLETNASPMCCGCFMHWQTLHADVVVIITNARADLNCIPGAFGHRTFDTLTTRLLVQQSRIKVGQTFHPIPETAALEAYLTAHRLVIGNSPTEIHRKLIVVWNRIECKLGETHFLEFVHTERHFCS